MKLKSVPTRVLLLCRKGVRDRLRYNRKSKTAGTIDDVGFTFRVPYSAVSIANSKFDGFPTSLLDIPCSILDIQSETFHCILGILACLP